MVTILGMDQYPEPTGFEADDVRVRLDHARTDTPRFVIEIPGFDITLGVEAAARITAQLMILSDAL